VPHRLQRLARLEAGGEGVIRPGDRDRVVPRRLGLPSDAGHRSRADVPGDPARVVVSEPPLVEEGRRLVSEAAARGVALRLLGGVAIWARSSNGAREALGRPYPDLDLAARKKESRRLRDLLEELGYEPERVFNATHGARRLLYHAADRSYHLDVFLDELGMSHNLDLGERLNVEELTVPAAEL